MLGPSRDRQHTKDGPTGGETQDKKKKKDLICFWSDARRLRSRDGDIASDIQRLVERDTKAANMLDVLAKNLLTLVNPTISKCAPTFICAAYGRSVYGYASLAHVIVSFTC